MMKPETRSTLCDSRLLEAREAHFARLDALWRGESLAAPFVLHGVVGKSSADQYSDPERWLDECLDDLAAQAEKLLDPVDFRPLIVQFSPYNIHMIDRMFGARVYFDADQGQWWSDPIDTPIGELRRPDLDKDETWSLARSMVEAFVAREVTVPFKGRFFQKVP